MSIVKKGDFIELDYTGYLEDNTIFDTTIEANAKKGNIFDPSVKYKSLSVCVGKRQLIKGLDDAVEGKTVGDKFSITVGPQNAFGNKSAQLMQLIPLAKFRQEKVQPFVGLQVNIDGMVGVVRTVNGGRVIVDFNHPLASKTLKYDVVVNKIITDNSEKIASVVTLWGVHAESKLENDTVTITTPFEIPKSIENKFIDDLKEAVPSIINVHFTVKDKQ